jgi:hypothetical protein
MKASREHQAEKSEKLDDALHKLIQLLTSEGWEPVSRGKYFFSYRFRRRVTSE